jgi:alpha,alpha-trehalase
MRSKFLWFVIFFIASCQRQHKPSIDFYSSELFQRVQLDTVFLDSKTFVDCIPKLPLSEILDRYETEKKSTTFDLKKFVLSNFELPHQQIPKLSADVSLEVHLNHLWTILQRNPDEPNSSSSLIPLPHTYVVPGGRFTEIYYWDSYFTMLGLMPDHKALVKDMIDNFSFLIDSIG